MLNGDHPLNEPLPADEISIESAFVELPAAACRMVLARPLACSDDDDSSSGEEEEEGEEEGEKEGMEEEEETEEDEEENSGEGVNAMTNSS